MTRLEVVQGKDAPRITILMPVYNGERYLDEAIESVFEQDYQDFELVIVDDGSTDRTSEILASWAAREPRVVLARRTVNSGVAASLNRGLELARGEYIARHDADDIFVSGRLRAQAAALDADPRVMLVSGKFTLVDTGGRRLSTSSQLESAEVTAHLLHFSNAVGGHAQVMFRKEVVLAIGGYDPLLELCEDYDLWTRLADLGRIVTLPIICMKYRLHPDRASMKFSDLQISRSVGISRRMLDRLLGREITDSEISAVQSVWEAQGRVIDVSDAHRVFTESYLRFMRTNDNPGHRSRVRVVTARRWVRSAARMAANGSFGAMLVHLAYAMRWHPFGLISGTAIVSGNAVALLWRRAGRWSRASR